MVKLAEIVIPLFSNRWNIHLVLEWLWRNHFGQSLFTEITFRSPYSKDWLKYDCDFYTNHYNVYWFHISHLGLTVSLICLFISYSLKSADISLRDYWQSMWSVIFYSIVLLTFRIYYIRGENCCFKILKYFNLNTSLYKTNAKTYHHILNCRIYINVYLTCMHKCWYPCENLHDEIPLNTSEKS